MIHIHTFIFSTKISKLLSKIFNRKGEEVFLEQSERESEKRKSSLKKEEKKVFISLSLSQNCGTKVLIHLSNPYIYHI